MVTLLVKQTLWLPAISNNLTPLDFKMKISLPFSSLPCVLHVSCPSHPFWFHLMPNSLSFFHFLYFLLVNDILIYKHILKRSSERKDYVIMPTPISEYTCSKSFIQWKFRGRAALNSMKSTLQPHCIHLCFVQFFLYNTNWSLYRVSINSFPNYKHLLHENYVEYKHIFFFKM